MAPHSDILEQPERLRGPFLGSVLLHVSIAVAVAGGSWMQGRSSRFQWGSPEGGGLGSAVAVSVTPRIPLPTVGGPLNPLANDTESKAPEAPPAKSKSLPRRAEPEDGIPLPGRAATKRPSAAGSERNKLREQEQDAANQVYSSSGRRLVDPMVGMTGGGGTRIGNNSPFGTQYGWYADAVKNKVAQRWQTGALDRRIPSGKEVVLTFTIRRDGSVPYESVRITQPSGIAALDMSAKRAIVESQPFGPLPQGFSRQAVEIEFIFELRR